MNGSRAWFEKDFYGVLGVAENASADEIKRAYKKIAQQNHPDRNPGDKAAEERMKDASEAYAVVGDAAKRKEYDDIRRMSRAGYAPGAGGFGGGGVPFDLDDLFGGIFGGRGARANRRGPDLEAHVRISFEDAVRGVTVPVKVRRDAPCSSCNGSGDRSGRAQTCASCGGSGVTQQSQGMFSFARPCGACGGSGRTVADPCPSCRGAGVERRADEVKVKIPAGIGDGARIRVRGRGGAVTGGETGDLYVVVGVSQHDVFGRAGSDLTLALPVSFAQAALGANVTVPTLDGEVTLKVPAGTQPGKVLRVRGKGINGGDLLVTVKVEVPSKLSKRERELIEQLAEAGGDGTRNGAGRVRARK